MARALTFAAGILCGLVIAAVGSVAHASDVDATYKKLRVFSQVLTYIQTSYVDEVDGKTLMYDAINGMLSHLDPHTQFLPAEEYEKLREDTTGEFGGLGISVGAQGGLVVVEDVHKDGPGAHAGLKIGDLITAVDGHSVRDQPLDTAVKLMRGAPGTKVVLTISRAAWSRPREIPLIRRQVRTKSVVHDVFAAPGLPVVGYVAIASFQERTDLELGAALADVKKAARDKGLDRPSGVILDLRDNPGGLLDEGVKVADRFLDKGLIVRTEGRNPKNAEKESAHQDGTEPNYPLVVLVNGLTASASEIVAAALQDHKRAVVVGERSFGKGSVQTLYGLDDGAGLKLTVARYYTPSGRSIHGSGVQPEVVVRPTLSPLGLTGMARVEKDAQLKAALGRLSRM